MVNHTPCFVLPLTVFCVVAACVANASDKVRPGTKISGPKYDGDGGRGNAAFIFPTIDYPSENQQQTMLPGGTLGISIPERPPSKSHSKVLTHGLTDLGNAATLEVRFRGGYLPVMGEEREIVTAKELRGKFALLDLPELPAAMKWDIAYDDLDAGIDRDGDGLADVTLLVVERGGDEPAMPALTPRQRLLVEAKIAFSNKWLVKMRKLNLESATSVGSLVEKAEQVAKDARAETNPRRRTDLERAARQIQESADRAMEQHQRKLSRARDIEQDTIRYKQLLKRDRE